VQLRSAIELYPDYWFDYLFLGRAYEQKANPEEAVETFRKGLQLEDNTELWAGLGHALAVSGKREEALKVLDHLDELAKHRCVAPYNFALVHIGLGQNDQAFEWLRSRVQHQKAVAKTDLAAKLTSLIGRTASSNTAMGCKNHGYPSWNTYAASRAPASGRLFNVSK
jgi:tetratricopeptide (TPR) repeat protein